MLRILTVQLEVAELRVRDEFPVEEHRTADPRAERCENCETLRADRRPVARLGDARGIRVVDEVDVPPELLLEEGFRLETDPLLRDVRR